MERSDEQLFMVKPGALSSKLHDGSECVGGMDSNARCFIYTRTDTHTHTHIHVQTHTHASISNVAHTINLMNSQSCFQSDACKLVL